MDPPALSIASFDYLKRPEVLRGLAGVTWDVLVIDEAHAVSGDTERAAAARLLAANARRVVLLTATPHAGDDDQFARCAGSDGLPAAWMPTPILMFRRSRAQVGPGVRSPPASAARCVRRRARAAPARRAGALRACRVG